MFIADESEGAIDILQLVFSECLWFSLNNNGIIFRFTESFESMQIKLRIVWDCHLRFIFHLKEVMQSDFNSRPDCNGKIQLFYIPLSIFFACFSQYRLYFFLFLFYFLSFISLVNFIRSSYLSFHLWIIIIRFLIFVHQI